MTGAAGAPLLLDGGMATELQRAGLSVTAPWWTTAALRDEASRRLLREVHAAYVAAGADVLTANTFRTNLRALERAGVAVDAAVTYVRNAVADARAVSEAAGGRVLVAASVAPLEDCYQPSLVPDDHTLRTEHDWHVGALADAGVDIVLVETMNTSREALAAAQAATRRGLRTFVSFVCGDGARLLSGESVAEAARRVEDAGCAAVLVNCTTPERCDAALAALADACAGPIGCYPNVEDRSSLPENVPVDRYVPVRDGPAGFARTASDWAQRYQLGVLGGCCGTTPEHIEALAARLGGRHAPGRVVTG
ncbi:homocysteine S-methyltransferase family protein [Micromonospora sp. NPDC005220]|uniref:homocysteine S-methyltransferase family protein n=1 Tax=Micromonospora sp. NPDC005220 TaxID=3155589 RepID=UPI0033B5D1F1